MPTKNQLDEAISFITPNLSNLAGEALENLAEDYGPSIDDMEDEARNEAESLLGWNDDCFSYLQDNNITDWQEAIDDGADGVMSVAIFFLEKEINEAISKLRAIDFDLEYPEEDEDEEEGD